VLATSSRRTAPFSLSCIGLECLFLEAALALVMQSGHQVVHAMHADDRARCADAGCGAASRLAGCSLPTCTPTLGRQITHPPSTPESLSLPVISRLVSPVPLCRLMSSLRRALAVNPEHKSHRQILSDH
jgi:hypothetical protein